MNKVLHGLEKISDTLFKWFTNDFLEASSKKSHLLTISAQEIQINIGGMSISSSKCEKLLGIHIDKKLIFEPHISPLCKKASQKINASARIAYSLKFEQRRLLLNAFITSQFSYTSVVWIFYNWKLTNHINCIHDSTFDDRFLKMHDSNLQKLLTEIFKVKLKLASEIMNEVFDTIVCLYSLRNELRFKSRNIRTVRYVIEIAAFVGSRIWSYMPSELKESMSLNEFRSKKKQTWKPENCPCKLYLQRTAYLQVTD